MSINTGFRTVANDRNVEALVDPFGNQVIRFSPQHTEAFGALRVAQFSPTCGWTFAYNINAGLINSSTDGVTGGVNHADR